MSATVAVSEFERRALGKVKRYLLAYILLGQVVFNLDRTNIGFAQLTMGKDLHLSAQAFGLAAGIFALSGFAMQLPAGLFFEKFGARRWLTFIMLGWGLTCFIQAFVTSGLQLTITRLFIGLFEAGWLPGANLLITIWFRGKNQGMATSLLMIGLGLAGVIGGPFAGWVLGMHFFGLVGWRNLFLLEGGFTVIWTLIALLILNDNPAKTRWLNPEERKFMVNYLSEDQAEKTRHGALVTSGVWSVLKDIRIVMLILCYTCAGWTTATFIFFNPTLLKAAGHAVSNQYVGYLSIGPFVFGAVACYYWGRHADRTERHWHCVLPLLVAAAGILLFPIAKGAPLLAMACLIMVQIGVNCFFVTFWPTCNQVVGKQSIAKTTAFISAGSQFGSLVGPIFFGWAIDKTGGTNLGMYTGVGVLLLNFVIMNVFFFRYKPQQKAAAAKVVVHA